MSVGGAGKATGIAALLVVGAVLLAAGGLPALGGHTPIDAVSPSAGEQVESAVAGDGAPQDLDGDPAAGDGAGQVDGVDGDDAADTAESQLDESVAAAAEDAEVGGVTRALAGALAVMFGDDIGGELGDSTAGVDPDAVDGDAVDADADELAGDADALDGDADAPDVDADASDVDAEAADADISDIDADGADGDAAAADNLPEDVDPADLPDGVEPEDIDSEMVGDDGELDADAFSEDAEPSEFDAEERDLLESLASEDTDTDDDDAGGVADRASEIEGVVDSDTRTAGIVVGGLLALLVAVLAYRSEKPFVEFLLAIPTRVAETLVSAIFTVAAVFERAISRLREVTSLSELRAVIVAALSEAKQSATTSIRSLFSEEPTTAAVETETVMSEREQIRSAWRTVVELVSVSRYRRQTPAAIKQQAVDSGLPEPPVSTLLGAFRAVEYGERDPTVRAESAVDAATQVEAAAQSMAEAAQDEETSTDELADATGGKSADATGEKSADATGDEPTADTREESE